MDLAKAKSWNHWFKNIASRNNNAVVTSLRAAGGGTNAYIHGLQPRLYHLTGGVVATLATADNDQGRQRYTDIQTYFTKIFGPPYVVTARYVNQQIQRRQSRQRFSMRLKKHLCQHSMKQWV
jgi:hypothetical protein